MNDWLIHCQNTTAGTVLSKIINFNNNVKGPQTVFFFFYVKSQFLLKKFYWILDLQVKMRVWQEPILSIWIGHGKSRFVIPEASLVWWRGGDREAMMVQIWMWWPPTWLKAFYWPVPLQHGPCYCHSTRYLEGHTTHEIHSLTSIWMECRVHQMFCIPQLFNRHFVCLTLSVSYL